LVNKGFSAHKIVTKIKTWSQFHQHFTRPFFVQKFFQSQTLSREKQQKKLLYEKCARKMLMKMTTSDEIVQFLHNFWVFNDFAAHLKKFNGKLTGRETKF